MSGPPHVHIDGPVNKWLNWGQYNACDRPLGAHHVSSEDAQVRLCYRECIPGWQYHGCVDTCGSGALQVLFDAEDHSKQPNMADILVAIDQHKPLSFQADCRYLPQPEFLLADTAASQLECLNKCWANDRCKTWSFLGKWHSCQLMTKLTQATKHVHSLCGVLVHRYTCDLDMPNPPTFVR